ncbi:MAG: hypothetical protein JWP38_3705 [Herbaspirillum sp.]|nr:hypothetical protein [Herbaspirillum sp.]
MENKIDYTLLDRLVAKIDKGGEPPDDGDMERLSALEARFDAVLPTLATRTDIESVKSEIHKSSGETHKWMLGTVIGLFLGFGGLFLAMSNALKPAAPQPAAAPIVIYSQPALPIEHPQAPPAAK